MTYKPGFLSSAFIVQNPRQLPLVKSFLPAGVSFSNEFEIEQRLKFYGFHTSLSLGYLYSTVKYKTLRNSTPLPTQILEDEKTFLNIQFGGGYDLPLKRGLLVPYLKFGVNLPIVSKTTYKVAGNSVYFENNLLRVDRVPIGLVGNVGVDYQTLFSEKYNWGFQLSVGPFMGLVTRSFEAEEVFLLAGFRLRLTLGQY